MVVISGQKVGATGFGLMGFGFLPPEEQEQQAFPAMRAALASGANFWNGGEFYGKIEGPNSLTLLKSYFTKYPEDADKVILCIKGGLTAGFKLDGSPEGLRASIDNCLSQLPPSVKKIDIWEAARVDPEVPIETQIGALAELVKEGKIGAIGLSEVKAETVRRAAKVHRIASVEIELSMWETRNIENGVLATCAELDIPVLAYSPLGQGFLAGRFQQRSDLPANDPRLHFPRYSEENFPKNVDLLHKVQAYAETKGCTPAQLALAWVRGFSDKAGFPQTLPLPGATTVARIEENGKEVALTKEEDKDIDNLLQQLVASGDRYPPAVMKMMEG